MPLQTIKLKPGIVTDDTAYSAEGGWADSDKIRFWNGKPEKLGGWNKFSSSSFSGTCRGLISWRDNSSNALMAIGTHTHLYVYKGGLLTDITPVQKTSSTLDDYFTTVSGSNLVTVNIATHGCQVGDRVIFGAFSGNNISWAADT